MSDITTDRESQSTDPLKVSRLTTFQRIFCSILHYTPLIKTFILIAFNLACSFLDLYLKQSLLEASGVTMLICNSHQKHMLSDPANFINQHHFRNLCKSKDIMLRWKVEFRWFVLGPLITYCCFSWLAITKAIFRTENHPESRMPESSILEVGFKVWFKQLCRDKRRLRKYVLFISWAIITITTTVLYFKRDWFLSASYLIFFPELDTNVQSKVPSWVVYNLCEGRKDKFCYPFQVYSSDRPLQLQYPTLLVCTMASWIFFCDLLSDIWRRVLSDDNEADLRRELKDFGTQLLQQLNTIGTQLNEKLDTIGKELNKKVDAIGTQLNEKLDTIGKQLNKKVDAIGTQLNEKLDTIGTSLLEKVGENGNQFSQKPETTRSMEKPDSEPKDGCKKPTPQPQNNPVKEGTPTTHLNEIQKEKQSYKREGDLEEEKENEDGRNEENPDNPVSPDPHAADEKV